MRAEREEQTVLAANRRAAPSPPVMASTPVGPSAFVNRYT
jgi:hypothetical protein